MTNEQLQNINATLIKQRDEAELKVQQLVTLIEDKLYPYVGSDKEWLDKALLEIGV